MEYIIIHFVKIVYKSVHISENKIIFLDEDPS